jgi:hypothetical protein
MGISDNDNLSPVSWTFQISIKVSDRTSFFANSLGSLWMIVFVGHSLFNVRTAHC